MDTQRILEAVDEAFTRTGAATPPWPRPRPWMREPLEEEYSRCAEPGKYRILRARGEAWAEALSGLGLAVVETAGPAPQPGGADPAPDRVVRVRPSKEQSIPLVLEFAPVRGEPGVSVTVGAGDPAVELRTLPDCGCDACDHGSAELLEEIDEYVSAIVSGDLVHLSGKKGSAVSTGQGSSASGKLARRDHSALLDRAREGQSRKLAGLRVVHGERWW